MGMPQTKTKTNANTPIGAPAIIVRRKLSEIISSGDLRPGQALPGKDIILVTVREPMNQRGEGLGRTLAFFGSPENLPGEPRTFNQNVAEIGKLRDWHGHDGWKFDRKRYGTSSYEVGLFKGYRDGSTIGKWGVPEMPLLNGDGRDGRAVNPGRNMLVLSSSKGKAFYTTFYSKKFVTSGSHDGQWFHTCTEDPTTPSFALSVHFPVGQVTWGPKNSDISRACVRPVVALELNRLVL